MFLDSILNKNEKEDNEKLFLDEILKCVNIKRLEDLMKKTVFNNNNIKVTILFTSSATYFQALSIIYMLYKMLERCLINGENIDKLFNSLAGFMIYINILGLGLISLCLENLKENHAHEKWRLNIIKKKTS